MMLRRGVEAVLEGRRATHIYVRRRSIKTLSIRADSWLMKATESVDATGGYESLRWTQTVVGWNGQRRKESTSVDVQKNSPKDRGKENEAGTLRYRSPRSGRIFEKNRCFCDRAMSGSGLNEVGCVGFPQRRLREDE